MRVVNNFFPVLVACVCLNVSRLCNAYPIGAGMCATGPVIGIKSGGTHSTTSSGAVESADLVVMLGNKTLSATEVNVVDANTAKSISISAASSSDNFKGFLCRLSGTNGANPVGAIIATDTGNTQVLESTGEATGMPATCATDVAGFTHTNSNTKQSIQGDFQFLGNASLFLEVTVVKSGVLDWYYSAYNLTFQTNAGMSSSPTPAPINLPTDGTTGTVSPSPSSTQSRSPVTSVPTPTVLRTQPPATIENTSPTNGATSVTTAFYGFLISIVLGFLEVTM